MTIARVQYAKSATGGNTTSISATLSATTAGNFLVAVVTIGGNQTPTPPASWVKAVGPISTEASPVTNIFIYYLENCASGITSVAFTLTSNGANLAVWEVSGIATSSSLDQTASSANQATNPKDSGTTSATTLADELVIAGVTTHQGSTVTWSAQTAGYTNEAVVGSSGASNNPWTQPALLIVSSTGAQDYQATASLQNGGAGVIATFKAGGGTVTGSSTMGGGPDGLQDAIVNQTENTFTAGLLQGGLASVVNMPATSPEGGAGGLASVASLTISGVFNLGAAGGGLLAFSDALTGIILFGDVGGGLLATAAPPPFQVLMGANGGGLYPFFIGAHMGSVGAGLSIPLAFVGNANGHWVVVLVQIWRPPGQWNIIPVKMWRSPGQWKPLST